jgi:hypothetical protein
MRELRALDQGLAGAGTPLRVQRGVCTTLRVEVCAVCGRNQCRRGVCAVCVTARG